MRVGEARPWGCSRLLFISQSLAVREGQSRERSTSISVQNRSGGGGCGGGVEGNKINGPRAGLYGRRIAMETGRVRDELIASLGEPAVPQIRRRN